MHSPHYKRAGFFFFKFINMASFFILWCFVHVLKPTYSIDCTKTVGEIPYASDVLADGLSADSLTVSHQGINSGLYYSVYGGAVIQWSYNGVDSYEEGGYFYNSNYSTKLNLKILFLFLCVIFRTFDYEFLFNLDK